MHWKVKDFFKESVMFCFSLGAFNCLFHPSQLSLHTRSIKFFIGKSVQAITLVKNKTREFAESDLYGIVYSIKLAFR